MLGDTTATTLESDVEVNCVPTLERGMTVACFLSQYGDEEPQIGRIVTLANDSDELEIEWMRGTYYEPWIVYKSRRGKTWRETIPFSSVLFPIKLSASGRINKAEKSVLKQAYEKRRQIS